jgi:hypothetical protein
VTEQPRGRRCRRRQRGLVSPSFLLTIGRQAVAGPVHARGGA